MGDRKECVNCTKKKATLFTTIENGATTTRKTCMHCPLAPSLPTQSSKSIRCPVCKTKKSSIASDYAVGCMECVVEFEECIATFQQECGITYAKSSKVVFKPGYLLYTSKSANEWLYSSMSRAIKAELYEHAAWLKNSLSSISSTKATVWEMV